MRALLVVLLLSTFVPSLSASGLGNHPEAFRAIPLFFGDPAAEPSTASCLGDEDGRVGLIVDLRDDIDDGERAAFARRYDIELREVSVFTRCIRFFRTFVKPVRVARLLKNLKQDTSVEIAEPDVIYRALAFPNDPLYRHQWHLDQIKMPVAWQLASGEDVVVAVIDTGVAAEDYGRFRKAEDLSRTEFVPGWDFVHKNSHCIDDNGHGTHVAGTIAQSTNNKLGCAGVGLRVKIMPLKVLTGAGFGSAADIAAAIRWAADHKANVINMSLGSSLPSYSIKKACDYAHAKGVTIVCAAGNTGRRGVGYPAKFANCIGVSATRFDETITFYSSWGKGVDLAAPGGDTRVDQNGDGMPDGVLQNTFMRGDPEKGGYYNFMGTSMASPHVAGVAALVISQGISNPEKVREILKKSARVKGSGPEDEKYGAGILNAAEAVRLASASGGRDDTTLLLILLALVLLTWLLIHALKKIYPRHSCEWFVGLLLGSFGLLGWCLGHWHGGAGVLTDGVPAWGMRLFGLGWSGSLLFRSALLPVLCLCLLSGLKRLRPVIAGLALGMSASLLASAWNPLVDLPAFDGTMYDVCWLLLNGAAAYCCALAIELRRVTEGN